MQEHAEDEKFMRRCLELAGQGKGCVAPNPMVGAVVVYDGSIIGEGFHRSFGGAHAEPNAINSVTRQELLSRASLYVNLEPCAHFGKTPPCADYIIEKKIPRVIIGSADPNEFVSGKGKMLLEKNGIRVTTGVLEKDCLRLNKRYFTHHLKRRPYIILKWARSADGYIDLDRPPGSPVGPNWITSQTARILVHKWRSEEQAILVGTKTVLKDNPMLNVRYWKGRNPLRVIIDRGRKIGWDHHVLDNSQPTLVFTEQDIPDNANTRFSRIVFDTTAENQMLEVLYGENIQSLIIEGGAFTLNRFIQKGLWDEARVFTGTSFFRGGVKSPEISGKSEESTVIDNSLLRIFHNEPSR